MTTKKNGCGAWGQTATSFGLQVVPHFTSGIVEWANHASVHENHGPWVDNFKPEENRNTSLFQAFRPVWGASLNCTPRKRGGRGGGAQETSLPLFPSSLHSFLFLREFFSCAPLSERLEQAKEVRWIYLGLENLNLWYQFYNSHSFFNLQSIVQLLMTIIIRCYPTRNIEIQRGRFFFSKKLPLVSMDLLFSNDLRNRPYVTNRKTAYTQLPVFSLYDYGWRSEFQLFAYSSYSCRWLTEEDTRSLHERIRRQTIIVKEL